MVAILRTDALTRDFGRLRAVDGVSLEVGEGDLFGLLGLNGAGKTTTLRMALGLIRPTSGRVEMFGRDAGAHFIEVMTHVGALVELPAYYPHLSAARNLEIVRLLTPGTPEGRIPEVLEQVGLGARMRDAVRTYSQGMRQRLGIAMAILHEPKLVFLDEPTNGLDPAGINQVRELIRRLNKEKGITFVISSHLLHEVEITCNRVAIIKQGRLVVQDRVGALLARTGGLVRIEAEPRARAKEVLAGLGCAPSDADDGAILAKAEPSRHAELNAALVGAGVAVRAFVPRRMTLEEFFLAT
jgi:ABC-2 type transport system ATP-binding protein